MKKLYIENLGCAKNQVDAEVMAYTLRNTYTLTEEADDADLILVNTCGFIESAKEESLTTFFTLRNDYPDKKIILSGCLAQRYANELSEELKEADAIFGNRDLRKIRDLAEALNTETKTTKPLCMVPEYPDPMEEDDTRDHLFTFPGSAYLKISEGCNHCCSYCAIPVIRGPLRSRPMEAILKEAKRLIDSGIKELNLIAQDLSAYGWDWDKVSHFEELLDKLCALEGDFKIRMLYIHPDWMTDRIIECVKRNEKILHYFDIPFQHASAPILKSMGRTGDLNSYIALIEKIRKNIPDAVIRTTLMLGFPGETEEDYRELVTFTKICRFNWMGSFVYSREEDTRAFDMTDEKTHEELSKISDKRQKKLQKIQEKITEEKLQDFVGNEYSVLIEELISGEDLAIGRIYSQAPEVDGLTVVMGRNMVPGNIYKCRITAVRDVDLEAVKID
ncbi:MAG: 30S ribosomal protein S12 methylthiotransferase RimO [Sphaerochaetaceae bacterium]|nr:30S ribosomal protein S12 methylthiotransferase RimO [Sphaerochaetaceae bacterium]